MPKLERSKDRPGDRILLPDQNVLGELLSPKWSSAESYSTVNNLIAVGHAPPTGRFTLSGVLEVLGFRLCAADALRSIADSESPTFPEMTNYVLNSATLFKGVRA